MLVAFVLVFALTGCSSAAFAVAPDAAEDVVTVDPLPEAAPEAMGLGSTDPPADADAHAGQVDAAPEADPDTAHDAQSTPEADPPTDAVPPEAGPVEASPPHEASTPPVMDAAPEAEAGREYCCLQATECIVVEDGGAVVYVPAEKCMWIP